MNVYLDLETTGLRIGVDRVTSFSAVTADGRVYSTLVNPEMPIPPDVAALTGIDDARVAGAPTFAACAGAINDFLAGKVLVGFGINDFDLPMLAEEMLRAGVGFDWQAFTVIDCGAIFKKKEPRTLAAAMKFYAGVEHVNAHDSLADALATRDVYEGIRRRYEDVAKMTPEKMAKFSRLSDDKRKVDPAGKLAYDDAGEVVFAFGKNAGKRVTANWEYVEWMLHSDFPLTTKAALRKVVGDDGMDGGAF